MGTERPLVRIVAASAAYLLLGTASPIAAQQPAPPPSLPPSPAEAPLADLEVPQGFTISLFARDLVGARLMAVSPEGTLVVARPRAQQLVALPDRNRDGRAEPEIVLSGLANPHSLAFKDGYLYVGTTPAVLRVKWADGKPQGTPETFAELPSSTPSQHTSRTIAFGPDGRLYVSIGSSCNVCVEPDARRTTIQVFNADGSSGRTFAAGLRNAIGFDWDPETKRLWAHDMGQEGLGNTFPPDEINLLEDGKHYGFPYFVGQSVPTTAAEVKDVAPPISAAQAVRPILELPPHFSAIDMRFYTGRQFPAAYRSALFMAVHGSSTRTDEKIGYKVVRIVMKDGRPASLEDFVTGWLKGDEVLGRPAGLATGSDGALYISDDNKGFVYRVAAAAR